MQPRRLKTLSATAALVVGLTVLPLATASAAEPLPPGTYALEGSFGSVVVTVDDAGAPGVTGAPDGTIVSFRFDDEGRVLDEFEVRTPDGRAFDVDVDVVDGAWTAEVDEVTDEAPTADPVDATVPDDGSTDEDGADAGSDDEPATADPAVDSDPDGSDDGSADGEATEDGAIDDGASADDEPTFGQVQSELARGDHGEDFGQQTAARAHERNEERRAAREAERDEDERDEDVADDTDEREADEREDDEREDDEREDDIAERDVEEAERDDEDGAEDADERDDVDEADADDADADEGDDDEADERGRPDADERPGRGRGRGGRG